MSHHGDRFFITTNDGAPNFRLVSAPVTDPSRERWTEVLPHRPGVKVDSTDAFRDHLVVYEREAGLRQIRIVDLASTAARRTSSPSPSRSTPSASTRTPSTTPRCSASPTPRW